MNNIELNGMVVRVYGDIDSPTTTLEIEIPQKDFKKLTANILYKKVRIMEVKK